MKNLLLAAALAFVPTASQAAVTINFSGVTFAYDPSQPLIGSYERSDRIGRKLLDLDRHRPPGRVGQPHDRHRAGGGQWRDAARCVV